MTSGRIESMIEDVADAKKWLWIAEERLAVARLELNGAWGAADNLRDRIAVRVEEGGPWS